MTESWGELLGREAHDRKRTDLAIADDRRYDVLLETLALPGGATFAGRHWCTDHRRCERAEAGLPDEPHPDAAAEVSDRRRRVEPVALAGDWAEAL